MFFSTFPAQHGLPTEPNCKALFLKKVIIIFVSLFQCSVLNNFKLFGK